MGRRNEIEQETWVNFLAEILFDQGIDFRSKRPIPISEFKDERRRTVNQRSLQ